MLMLSKNRETEGSQDHLQKGVNNFTGLNTVKGIETVQYFCKKYWKTRKIINRNFSSTYWYKCWLNRKFKLRNVYSGCLDSKFRWRTWPAAICLGELWASFDPGISEWGNLIQVMLYDPHSGWTLCELKHLSSRGKEINRDSLSSGERTGNSPNLHSCRGCRTPIWD